MPLRDPEARRSYHREYMRRRYQDDAEHRERQRQRVKANRPARRRQMQTLIRKAKDKACADCAVRYSYYVMDFDHVRGEKKFNVAEAVSKNGSIAGLLAEIAKCDVVCANCHRIRTYERLQ